MAPWPGLTRARGIVGVFLWLAACAPQAAPTVPNPACILAAQHPMVVAEMFFGRNTRGRGPVSEAEWADFAAAVVTPNFPDGFTAWDGEGQWRNPQTGHIAHDPTKILLVAASPSSDLGARLAAVMEAYKTRFHQQSVGVITRDSCGAF